MIRALNLDRVVSELFDSGQNVFREVCVVVDPSVDRRNSDVTFVDPQRLGLLRRRVLHLVDLFKF